MERREGIDVVELRGPEPGPTIALLGGVHGDEDEGILAVQRVSAVLREAPLASGTLRAVAVAHPAAHAANQRTSPVDGKDLARSFPGDSTGSVTERLAYELTERVIRGSDHLIDLHSAGGAYAMPNFVGYVNAPGEIGERAARAAAAFGAPLVWEHPPPPPPGRTTSVALDLGIPSIYVEGSGGGSLGHDELELYVNGVLRVLSHLGMLPNRSGSSPRPRAVVRGKGDLDGGIKAPSSGRFVAHRSPGEILSGGDPIGEIVDDDGRAGVTITAPTDATLMFVRRAARIAHGEIVCCLGTPPVPWSDG